MSSGWISVDLESIADVIDPQPSHRAPAFVQGGYSYVGIGDIDPEGRIRHEQCRKVSEVAVTEQERAFTIEYEDMGFGKVGTVGKVVYFKEPGRYAVSATLVLVKPKNSTDRHFLYHLLQSHQTVDNIRYRQTGTTRATLGIQQIRAFNYLVPSETDEQRRIAAVLDTIDAAIQQTDALIAKLRQMKAGLLHDLLTRGLDDNGELRDPVAHPEQFKDSPLGRIPREWEEVTLGTVVARAGGVIQTGPFGSQLHAYEYMTRGIPVIMPQDIEDGFISEAQIARISESKANSLARHRVQPNDVIFARRGDLSRCAAIGQREVGWFCGTGCLLVKADHDEIFGPWLAAIYQHDQSQRQILARAVGSTMVNLNTGLLSSLLLSKPDYSEQVAIMEALDAYNVRIRAEEATRDKLALLKRGLMDDLLTGRVRVTDLKEV